MCPRNYIIAEEYYELITQYQKTTPTMGEGVFENFNNVINAGGTAIFTPYCYGQRITNKVGLEYNYARNSISAICTYIPDAYVKYDNKVGFHDPRILDKAICAIKARIGVMRESCLECPIVGICRGGCVLSGIDGHNTINKAACAFQKTLWSLYVSDLCDEALGEIQK